MTEIKGREPKKTGAETTKRKVTQAEDYRSIYSNGVQLSISSWDVRLLFSEVAPSIQTGETVQEAKASVVMSHNHFEAMLGVLNRTWAKHLEEETAADSGRS